MSGTRAQPTREEQAAVLKESIYLVFATLSVTLAIRAHGDVSAPAALATLAVTLGGTVLAVFTADVLAHTVVHGVMMSRHEFAHAVRTSFGALSSVTLPFVFLCVSLITGWDVNAALLASTIALTVALVLICARAVHRVGLSWKQQVVMLTIEAALALAVIALQVMAHS
ncbi:hypothetical protein ACE11G_14575 [Gordonia sp. PS3]|nr:MULTISPECIES: hypothetical protein [Gordonia]KJR05876.1 hypothetical protein UG54_15280 [Gordonia sihwensis]KXT57113.1 hypothetical protein Y710_10030 [Gordonia sp. QH-12]WFN93411.1 hypothetical protein P5P27_02225 [Gordonia sihwensis]